MSTYKVQHDRTTGTWRLSERNAHVWTTLCTYDFCSEACAQALRMGTHMRQVSDNGSGLIVFGELDKMFLDGNLGSGIVRNVINSFIHAMLTLSGARFSDAAHRSGMMCYLKELAMIYRIDLEAEVTS